MSTPGHSPDWRGWIVLAWAIWFGLLYGRMVVEQRGGKLPGWIARMASEARASAKF